MESVHLSSENNEKRTALYFGSFDPITNGHLDIIERISHLFNNIIVIVAYNSLKSFMLTTKERVSIIKEASQQYKNIQVTSYSGLATQFASQYKLPILIRGLRTEADYVHEMQMAMMNKALTPNLETIFIPAQQHLSHISSSLIKDIINLGGNVNAFVPNAVIKHLKSTH